MLDPSDIDVAIDDLLTLDEVPYLGTSGSGRGGGENAAYLLGRMVLIEWNSQTSEELRRPSVDSTRRTLDSTPATRPPFAFGGQVEVGQGDARC